MGRSRAADETEMSPQARDLSAAVHARRTTTEVNSPMSQDRLLLRPADPTRRPRFDAEPGTRIDPVQGRARSRRLLGRVPAGLLTATAALLALAPVQVVAWWVPAPAPPGAGASLVGRRRAEFAGRAGLARAATGAGEERARAETARRRDAAVERSPASAQPALPAPAEAAATPAATPASRTDLDETSQRASQQVSRPGVWPPRTMPLPTYAMPAEADDRAG